MQLLERVQTTFSGWGITADLIPSTPPWAKKLSEIIRDSSAYKFVANNSRVVGLVGIGTYVITIGLIAHRYLNLKAKFEQSNQENKRISTELNEAKAAVDQLTAEKKVAEQSTQELTKINTSLQTKLDKAQADNKELKKELMSERKAPQEAQTKLTEENEYLKRQLATVRSDFLMQQTKTEEIEQQLSGVKTTLQNTRNLLHQKPKTTKNQKFKK